MHYPSVLLGLFTIAAATRTAWAADWPQWGGSPARNSVSQSKGLPVQWDVGVIESKTGRWNRQSAKNIRWVARLGSETYGSPVVADGKVFCGTNNGAVYLKQYPEEVDLGCLLCFRQGDGGFAWQLSCRKLAGGQAVDWPKQGICCAPLVEDKRLWLVTNRCEVVCLDTAGHAEPKNHGEPPAAPPGQREAKILWSFDMIGRLGVVPHNMSSCSVTAAGDLLLINTSNGVNESHTGVTAPRAPSFVALDKKTGKLLWADNSPGENILHGQWSSPTFAVIGGVPQAIFAGGDGWVYSFLARPAAGGKPEMLWKFDCHPKTSVWKNGGEGDRGTLVATPMVHDGRVFIATGEDPEFGQAPGHLWCIDAAKRGDVSPDLVFDRAGKPVAPRRLQAADPAVGHVVRPNPNSATVWHYSSFDADGDGKLDFKETMHRSLGMAAAKDGMLVIADLAGVVHCLDAATGKVHWTHDAMSTVWGTPLLAEGRIYLGDEDGDVLVFALSPQFKLLAKNNMRGAIYTSAAAADDTLYISTRYHLFAIGK